MTRLVAIVLPLLFTAFAEQSIAAETGVAVWCINVDGDVPTKIRQITHSGGDGGCYVYAETPYESNDLEVAYYNPKPSGMECEDQFAKIQLEQKDDGFRCGGWFVVEDMDRDLKESMDVALERIKDFMEYAAKQPYELTVLDMTMDFSGAGPWSEEEERKADPNGEQEYNFAGSAAAVVTFGRHPSPPDTDNYEAFVAYFDTNDPWQGSVDPSRTADGWNVVEIGNRTIHPCFGGGSQVTAIGVNHFMEVTEFDSWEIPNWHRDSCLPEAEGIKKAKGHKHYARKDDGSFELVDYDPR
ncbi:hypothetical protein [Rhizobium leguminosarum]